MARKLVVEVVGDARSLERSFAKANRSAKGFGRDMEKAGRGAAAASLSFSGIGRAVGTASAAFLGGAGIVYALKSTVAAAAEAQSQLAQTRNAVIRSGVSWGDHAKQIDATLQAQSNLSAFDDEELSATFANLVRRTGDVNEALRLNALSANVARGRNIDLAAAQALVLKASIGNVGALRRLGINLSKNATATQALDLLQKKYAGSASAFGRTAAGSMERFQVAIENAQESIGKALLPKIAELSTKFADFLNRPETQRKLEEFSQDTVRTVGKVQRTLSALNRGGQITQDVLATVFLSPLKNIDYFNDKVENASRSLRGLKSDGEKATISLSLGFAAATREALALKEAQRPSPIAARPGGVPLDVSGKIGLTLEQRNKFFDSRIGRLKDRVQDVTSLRGQIKALDEVAALVTKRIAATNDITRRLNLEDELLDVSRQQKGLRATIAANKLAADQLAADKKRERVENARALVVSKLNLALERAGLTPKLSDDITALKGVGANLRKQIAAGRDVVSAQTELVGVIGRIGDLRLQAVTDLADQADKIKSAILSKLQGKRTDVLNKQALTDANAQLALAKQLGGPSGIREATRGVDAAKFAIIEARLQRAPASLTGAGQFSIGNITINVNGSGDADKVADRVIEKIKRAGRHTSAPTRGSAAGIPHGI